MFKRLRFAFLWVRAVRRLAARNVADAFADIQAMERMAPLRAHEKAFKAGILLCLGDYDGAEKLYAEVIAKTADSDRANDRYVALYAKFMLADIREDAASAEALKVQAERVACTRDLRRWLPM